MRLSAPSNPHNFPHRTSIMFPFFDYLMDESIMKVVWSIDCLGFHPRKSASNSARMKTFQFKFIEKDFVIAKKNLVT